MEYYPEQCLDEESRGVQRRLRRTIDRIIDAGGMQTPEEVEATLTALAEALSSGATGVDLVTAKEVAELAYLEATLKD